MLNLRAIACQKLGRHGEAVADFTARLSHCPQDWVTYEMRADSYTALDDRARAEADRATAQSLAPKDALALSSLARRLLIEPVGGSDPVRALVLSRRAVALEPEICQFRNTLGLAQYRNGFWREAVTTLEANLAAGQGQWDGFDLFVLAMCHHRLGDAMKATTCHSRAIDWRHAQKGLSAKETRELSAFQAEAEALFRAL
jgi:uncharacterized protein HemY